MKNENKSLNWPLIGNSHIVDFLSKSLENEKISSSYIFDGPDNLGKTTTANLFSQIILCQNRKGKNLLCGACSSCEKFKININKNKHKNGENLSELHGDFYIIKKDKDKKNISIEQIREFIRKLSMSSFLNSYKVGIIKSAHTLSQEAANALLKTLEEPRDKVVVILVTSDIESLPETIVSRSQVLKFHPVEVNKIYDYLLNEHGASRSAAKNFSHLSQGRPALAVKFLQDKEFLNSYLDKVNIFLNFINQDINERIISINALISGFSPSKGDKLSGQEASTYVKRIIEVWTGLIRDMLLMEFNNKEIVQHEITGDKIMAIKNKYRTDKLINILNSLKQAGKYLESNINPKLVLEDIAIKV